MIHYVLDIIVVLLLVGVAVSACLCPSEAAVPYQGAALVVATVLSAWSIWWERRKRCR